MMKTREKRFTKKHQGVFHVGGRRAALLLALALGRLALQGAEGYPVMDNDRILLMNNDAKEGASITSQGYYDTNTSARTYWVHDATAVSVSMRSMLKGTNHTLFKHDGTKLWQLVDCRAGSGTVVGSASRNYIPWTETATSIIDGTTDIPVTSAGVRSFCGTPPPPASTLHITRRASAPSTSMPSMPLLPTRSTGQISSPLKSRRT